MMTAGLIESLRERRGFSVGGVLAANAGLLFAISLILLFAGGDDPSSWAIVGVGVVLLVGGWIIPLLLRFQFHDRLSNIHEQFLPMFTVLAVIGAALTVLGLAVVSVEGSNDLSTAIAWWPYFLLSIILFALWIIPGLQGRPFILGAALLNFTWAVAGIVAVSASERELRSSASSLLTTDGYYFNPQDIFRSAAAAGLAVGLIFLVVVFVFDWMGWHGLATPFLVAGVTATLMGAFGVASDASIISIGFLALCVVLVILVGVFGRRKSTIWIGGVMLAPALIAMCVKLLGDDPNHIVAGLFVGVCGVVVLGSVAVAAFFGPAIMNAYDDSIEQRVSEHR